MKHLPTSFPRVYPAGRQWAAFLAIAVVCIGLAHGADEFVWREWRDQRVNERDWGRMLRSLGYLPTWLIVAIALWLHDRGRPQWGWRGGLVIVAPIAGGAVAEGLKLLVRRLRPDPELFGYLWRPFSDQPWSTKGLGMPSSHVMVAFAGAAALAGLFPRSRWLWLVTAAGCAAVRVLSLGHFLSDAVAAAFAGYAVGALVALSGGFRKALPDRDLI